MIVTKVTEINKSKSRIEVDNEFAFVLYKGELRIYHVKEGKELSREAYDEIIKILQKRAKLRCMNLLKSRSYTEKQLRDKLKEGGYTQAVMEQAIAYVSSYGYINDAQYAQEYIEYNKEIKSRTRIINDLYRKGIDKETIDEIWNEMVGNNKQELEQEQILNWARKKNFCLEKATIAEKQKFFAFLFRKGFQIESIRKALLLDITSI